MSKQGLKPLFPMEDIAVMGIWELLPHLNKFRVCSWQFTFDNFLYMLVTLVDSFPFYALVVYKRKT